MYDMKRIMVAAAVATVATAWAADTYDHRVQYLESSGTQYIDSGVIPTGNTTFTATYEYVAFGNGTRANYDMIAGLVAANANRYYPVSLNGNAGTVTLRHERYVFSSNNPSKIHATLSRHKIIFNDDAHRVLVDGELIGAFTATLGTETKTCYLFAGNNNGQAAYSSASRIYECAFIENGTPVRKFIPVIDGNGVACMFDEVEEKLYYNLGTGTFTAGPVWTPEDEEPEVETPWYLVEYLESTGTQWINTGVFATSNTETRLGYKFPVEAQRNLAIIGGVAGASNSYRYYPVSVDGSNALKERYVYGTQQFVGVYPALQYHEVIFNDERRCLYVDGFWKGAFTAALSQREAPMYVFARANSNGNADYPPSNVRIWHYDIVEKGVPVRSFIPAVDTNGVACFHDRVSGTNHYNCGTGTFKVGRIISSEVPINLSARTDLAPGLKVLPFEVRPSYGTVFTLDEATAATYAAEVRADGVYLVAKESAGDAARVIEVTGDTAMQLVSGAMPACASIRLSGTVRLTADCDWTGLGTVIVPDGVIIDLNGHNLTVTGLAALPGTGALITDTASSGGELRMRVAENEVFSLHDGVSLIGKLKLVKEGAGTLVVMSSGHSYTGGTDVRGGIVRLACYRPAYYPDILGPEYSVVTIDPDGILDIDGNVGQRFRYVLNGGALTSCQETSENNRQSGTAFELASDSVVSNRSFGLLGANWGPVTVHMNGHTLHSVMASGNKFFVCNTTFKGEGTLRIESGWFKTVAYGETVNAASNLTVVIPYTYTGGLALETPFVVSNLVMHSPFSTGKGTLTVLGTYTPVESGTNNFPNIRLADGATLDLSRIEGGGTFDVASADVDKQYITFATNATVKVKLGGRSIPAGAPVVGWTAATKPDNLDTLKFVCGDEGVEYALEKREDGLYVVTGMTLFIR